MKRNAIFILTAFFIGESRALADEPCKYLLSDREQVLPGPVLKMKSTEGLIAYLGTLLENRVIGDKELSQLIENLLKGKMINPISKEEALISSAGQIHREGLQEYIDDQTLEQKFLLEWAQKTDAERKRVQVAREETRVVTQDLYQKMEFQPVPAGIFMMGEEESKIEIQLTRPFEIMSTPITQKMWAEVMDENPSEFKNGEYSIAFVVAGKSIQMQPNHPVETVSWDDVQVFIQKLNELDPAYHYRLPTEAEWEYAARAGTDTLYSFGKNSIELPFYAWYEENSQRQTHPVGELAPNAFGLYDMHGNVLEWVSNKHAYRISPSELVDPVGPTQGSNRVVRGGSWNDRAGKLRSSYRYFFDQNVCKSYIGARLVRTRRLPAN